MTHDQLIAALFPEGAPADYKAHALILDAAAVQAMQAAQQSVGSDRHKVQPVATTDGRWLVSADILTELAPGGLFAAAMEHFDGSKLGGVQVLPWADGVALLPGPVNINSEDPAELKRLDGVGDVLAQVIIAGQPWSDPAELSNIDGISDAMVADWSMSPGLAV